MRRILAAGLVGWFAFGLASPMLVAQGATEATAEKKVDLKKVRQEAQAAVEAGDWGAAAAAWRQVTEASPKDGQAWLMLGFSLHNDKKLDEALQAHVKATEFANVAQTAAYNASCVFALKGEKDKAIAWLEKAAALGFDRVDHIDGDSDMDSLRGDERFKKLVAKMANGEGSGGLQVYAPTTERKQARVAWFGRKGSPGQIAIDYAPVAWDDKYTKAIGSEKYMSKKWRFGADFWTTLDSSVAIALGGIEIPAGYYYLTLEQRPGGVFVLAAHDAKAVKEMQLDAYQADKLKGGIEVPLAYSKGNAPTKTLEIGLDMAEGSLDKGTLRVAFGEHLLTADAVISLPKK